MPFPRGGHHSEATRKKMSDSHKGKAPVWSLSPELSQQVKAKISAVHTGRPMPTHLKEKLRAIHKGQNLSPQHRAAISRGGQGKHHFTHTPEAKAKIAAAGKGRLLSPDTKAKISLKMKERRAHQHFPKLPTKPEKQFEAFCGHLDLPFEYVGNNRFRVGGINPDFVDKKKKVAVEIFGDYFHTPLLFRRALRSERTEEGRRGILKQHGWKLIVFWESELSLPDAKERVAKKLQGIYRRG